MTHNTYLHSALTAIIVRLKPAYGTTLAMKIERGGGIDGIDLNEDRAVGRSRTGSAALMEPSTSAPCGLRYSAPPFEGARE